MLELLYAMFIRESGPQVKSEFERKVASLQHFASDNVLPVINQIRDKVAPQDCLQPKIFRSPENQDHEARVACVLEWVQTSQKYGLVCDLVNSSRDQVIVRGKGAISPVISIDINDPDFKDKFQEALVEIFSDPQGNLADLED
jgi:hypothetical protein